VRSSRVLLNGWTTRLALAFFAVGAAVTLALTTANASSLPLSAGSASVSTAQGCSTASVTVTRAKPVYDRWWIFRWQTGWEGVELSNIPAACRNLPIQVTAGADEAAAVVPGGATSATLSVTMNGEYGLNTSTFALTINGWHLPTSLAP